MRLNVLGSRRAVVAVTEGAAGRTLHDGLLALEGNVRVIALAERAVTFLKLSF